MVEWMMLYVLESFRRSRIGVSAKKTNSNRLIEVNKHFFDVPRQTHISSRAAAGGSQLRWFYIFFVC